MGKRHPVSLLVSTWPSEATIQTNIENIQTTGNWPTLWPSHLTPGNEMKIAHEKMTCSAIMYSRKRHNSEDVEATYISVKSWVDKDAVEHLLYGILLKCNKEWNPVIYNKMAPTVFMNIYAVTDDWHSMLGK